MNIDMEFARRDDCLDKMVPSDLRVLIGERDRLLDENQRYKFALDVIIKKACDPVTMATAALEKTL